MKKRLKMYKQTVLLFIVLIVLAFATNVFFYAYNLNQIMRYRTTQIEQSSAFLGNQIGTQISYIHQYCRDILRRPELKTLETQNAQDAPWEYYSDVNDLLYKMNNSAVAGNFVEDSLLLLKNSDMVLSAKNGLSKWKESALQSSFENVDAVTRLQVQKIGGELYLFDFPQIYVRTAKFENLDTVLCIQLNQNVFVQYIKGYLSSDLVSMEFLQGDDPALLAYQIEQPRNTKLYELEQTISGTQQRLKLKFAIPMYGYSFMILSVLITVCFLLTIIGAVYYVNRMNVVIHKPIRKIIKAFKDVETGCYDVQLSGHETEEFSYLYEAIGNIVTQLKTSIETQYEQRLALQNSEIKQYQLQINPHFLYNGFYNIQRMCTNGQYDKAVLLSKRLASYYRYITRNGISFVPLAEEVRHMEDYIDIQSIRFQDRICIVRNYHLQDMPAVQVPRLIFQPILENVYEHAFNTVETNGLITITMQTDEKMLHCTIEDSGEGMPKDKMDELNAWLSQDSGYTECTGILNVNKRLKLHYGRQSGILYASGAQGCGVKIEMRICFENKGGEANV